MEPAHAQNSVVGKRIYKLLGKFCDEGVEDIDSDEEDCLLYEDFPSYFDALSDFLRIGNYQACAALIDYLMDEEACSKQFLWTMLNIYIQKNPSFFTPMTAEMGTHLTTKGIHQDEARLVNTIEFLNREMYDKAYQEASKFDGRGMSTDEHEDFRSKNAVATSALLATYKTMLHHQTIEDDDTEALTVMMNSFELLISKNVYLPLIADAYTFTLSKLGFQTQAEEFLSKYVDSQSGGMGVYAALHALCIAKLHFPKMNPAFSLNLLEMIAERSPGHPKVLELCRQYLYMQNSRSRRHSDTESNLDFESDSASVVSHTKENQANLLKCLKLMIYFLDTYVQVREIGPEVRDGWSLMADIARRICLKGSEECLECIAKFYHQDRKIWWHYFRRQPPVPLVPGDAELYSHQGVVCYVFETERHPFVSSLLKMKETTLLKSLVKQLRPSKVKFEALMQDFLIANKPIQRSLQDALTVDSAPIPPTSSLARLTPSLSNIKWIDTQGLAEKYNRSVERELRREAKYRVPGGTHKASLDILRAGQAVDIIPLRMERRQMYALRSSSRFSGRSFDCSLSAGSWCSSISELDDDTFDEYSTMCESFRKPRKIWEGRLRVGYGDSSYASSVSDAVLDAPTPLPPSQAQIQNMERWKLFLNKGSWTSPDNGSYDELSSNDDYVPDRLSTPEFSSGTDDELSTSQSELSVQVDEPTIKASYPVSICSSYPSLSPASSVSSIFTPRLSPFMNNQPVPHGEVIKNEDRYPFFEFDGMDTGMSVCSSTTEEIAHSIDQVLKRLECSMSESPPRDVARDETVTGVEEFVVEEDTDLADNTMVPTIDQRNVIAETILPETTTIPRLPGVPTQSLRVEEEIDDEVVEAGLANETLVSMPNRSFSRDFDASSPDMFVSDIEDEDDSAERSVIHVQNEESTSHQIEKDEEMTESSIAKLCNNIVKSALRRSSSIHFSPTVTSSAIKAGSKKKIKRKSSNKTSTPSQSAQNTQNTSATPQSSSIKKKKKKKTPTRRSSELAGWSVELVDRVIKEASMKEASSNAQSVQGGSPKTSDILQTSPKKARKGESREVSRSQPVKHAEKLKDLVSTSSVSQDVSISDTKTIVTSRSDVSRKSSQAFSTPRKCHTRRKDPRYWSDSEEDDGDDSDGGANPLDTVTSRPQNKRLPLNSARRQLPSTRPSVAQPVVVEEPVDSRQNTPGSDSETESPSRLIEKILAENMGRVKTPKSANQSDKKKKKMKNASKSRSSFSLKQDTIVEEEPVNVSQSIEELMKKYLGSEDSDDNAADKDKANKSSKERVPIKDRRSKVAKSDKSNKEKSAPARRSVIDQLQMDLVDRLLEEKGEPSSPPTIVANKKSVKRRNSARGDRRGSSEKPPSKLRKSSLSHAQH